MSDRVSDEGIQYKNEDRPWTDEELLYELYMERGISAQKISEKFDCSPTTINVWLEKHESTEKRSMTEALQLATRKYQNAVSYWTNHEGYPCWKDGDHQIAVHRVLAVCEWGPDAVAGMHVHHKNGCSFDNRVENLEVLTRGEHSSKHKKVVGVDRIRVAELYEHGDISSRALADELDLDISNGTVLRIHNEFYGDGS